MTGSEEENLWFGTLLKKLLEIFPLSPIRAAFSPLGYWKTCEEGPKIDWVSPSKAELYLCVWIPSGPDNSYYTVEFHVVPESDRVGVVLSLYCPQEIIHWMHPSVLRKDPSTGSTYPGMISPEELISWVERIVLPELSLKLFSCPC